MKEAFFHKKALETIRSFSKEVRKSVGKAIRNLQSGRHLSMPLSRPMPDVSLGVAELRVKDRGDQFRIFYYIKHWAGILVFHAFIKKSRETPKHEIEIGRKRLKGLIHETEQKIKPDQSKDS